MDGVVHDRRWRCKGKVVWTAWFTIEGGGVRAKSYGFLGIGFVRNQMGVGVLDRVICLDLPPFLSLALGLDRKS
jgi:hypothetical protein